MCRCAQAQELSLNYHCKCEQWVHFGTGSFFNFNGTAGVWRRKCIESIGGWNSRTTVRIFYPLTPAHRPADVSAPSAGGLQLVRNACM